MNSIDQDILRDILKDFLKESGFKQETLSQKLGLGSCSLANFKCGNFDLSEEKAQDLLNLIERLEGIS